MLIEKSLLKTIRFIKRSKVPSQFPSMIQEIQVAKDQVLLKS